MNILVIGSEAQQEETVQKFGPTHSYRLARQVSGVSGELSRLDVIFDFVSTENISQPPAYSGQHRIFFDTSFVQLSKVTTAPSVTSFGFCGFSTLMNRPLLEVTLRDERDRTDLENICRELQTDFRIVADRVGMISPRIICMIINEAYSAVEDGTATKEDIDLAMKLGTNYPYGPFEWCEKIGPANVVRLLDAVGGDTGDERYKVCSLLRSRSEF